MRSAELLRTETVFKTIDSNKRIIKNKQAAMPQFYRTI